MRAEALALLVLACFGKTVGDLSINLTNVKFYDLFGDETDLFISGGRMSVPCQSTDACSNDVHFHLCPPEPDFIQVSSKFRRQASTEHRCDESGKMMIFDIVVDMRFHLVNPEYCCKDTKTRVMSNRIIVMHRICDQEILAKDQECDQNSVNKHCAVTAPYNIREQCILPQCIRAGLDLGYRMCPGDKMSYCETLDSSKVPYIRWYGDKCPEDNEIAAFHHNGKNHQYDAHVRIDVGSTPNAHVFEFVGSPISPLWDAELTCQIKNRTALLQTVNGSLHFQIGGPKLRMNEDLLKSFQVLKIFCIAEKAGKKMAEFSNVLVIFPNSTAVISANDTDISCKMDAEVSSDFDQQLDLQRKGETKNQQGEILSGQYACQMNITYWSASPKRRFTVESKAQSVEYAKHPPILKPQYFRMLHWLDRQDGILHSDSGVGIECHPGAAELCGKYELYELITPDGSIVKTEHCRWGSVHFWFEKDKLKLGAYKCRYFKTSTDAVVLGYRTCTKSELISSGANCSGEAKNSYCIVDSQDQLSPCSTIRKEWCPFRGNPHVLDHMRNAVLCPGTKDGYNPFCSSLTDKKTPYAKVEGVPCPDNDDDVPRLEYPAGVAHSYNSHILVTKASRKFIITVGSSNHNNITDVTCWLIMRSHNMPFNATKTDERFEVDINEFSVGGGIVNTTAYVKMNCSLDNETMTGVAVLTNYLVLLDGIQPQLSLLTRGKKREVICRLDPPADEHIFDVAINLTFIRPGFYGCQITVTFRSSAPVITWSHTSHPFYANVDPLPPVLDEDNVVRYDEFNDEVELFYYGGYVIIQCDADMATSCTDQEDYDLLDPDNATVTTAKCNGTLKATMLRLNITDGLKFGDYRCRYKDNISTDTYKIDYHVCSNRDPSLSTIKDRCEIRLINAPQVFCMKTLADGSQPCTFIDPEHCFKATHNKGFIHCPTRTSGWQYSYCHAISHSHPKARLYGLEQCPTTEGEVPSVRYPHSSLDQASVHDYMATIIVDTSSTNDDVDGSVFGFPPLDASSFLIGSNLNCTIKSRGGGILDEQSAIVVAGEQLNLKFNETILNEGAKLLKLLCKYEKEGKELARLSNYVMIFPRESKAVIKVETDPDGVPNQLTCDLDSTDSDAFVVEHVWALATKNRGVLKKEDLNTYMCVLHVSYINVAPMDPVRIRFKDLSATYRIEEKTTIITTTMTSTEKTCPTCPTCTEGPTQPPASSCPPPASCSTSAPCTSAGKEHPPTEEDRGGAGSQPSVKLTYVVVCTMLSIIFAVNCAI